MSLLRGVLPVLFTLVLAGACSHAPPSEPRPESPSPAESTPPSAPLEIAATVDGEVITMESLNQRLQLNRGLSDDVEGMDEKFVLGAKHAILQRMIAEILIQKEALRQGISYETLIERITEDASVSDEEADLSYRLARDYKGGNPVLERRVRRLLAGGEQEARERIRAFFLDQKYWVAILNYTMPLREQSDIQIVLPTPDIRPEDVQKGR